MEYKARLGNYSLGKKLGAGQFSKVRIGIRDGKKYAVKYMLKSDNLYRDKTCLDLVLNEAKIMMQCNHPNIVKLFEFSDEGVIVKENGKEIPVLYLVFEFIPEGELFDFVAIGGRFPYPKTRHYLLELLAALSYLHGLGFAHRDIKAENVLLGDQFQIKLADFGFATLMRGKDNSGKLRTPKGTLGYMAPEILSGVAYEGSKVDIFATGVLLFTMVCGHPPFRKASTGDIFYKMLTSHNDVFWSKMEAAIAPEKYCPKFKDLANRMLALEPTSRPSIEEILAHPFMQEPITTAEENLTDGMLRKTKISELHRARVAAALEKKRKAGILTVDQKTKAAIEETKTAYHAVKRVLPKHSHEIEVHTTFFSIEDPLTIFSKLQEYCLEQKYIAEPQKHKYKLLITSHDFELGDIRLAIRIEQFDPEVNTIILQRVQGDKMEFLRIFNNLKDTLQEQEVIV